MRATGLPPVHLDRLAYRPGWQETPREERRVHREVLRRPEWVIDGNYTDVDKADRISRADLAIVLARPRRTCMARVLRRTAVRIGRARPDMAEGCRERFNVEFLRVCWDWHGRHPDYGAEISRQAGSTPVIVLRSRRDADELIDRVDRASSGGARSSGSPPPQ